MKNPQALFEVSWEVCNMVGGIHTVVATKVRKMQEYYGSQYFTIGPDISRINETTPAFREEIWNQEIHQELLGLGIGCRMGRWLVPGEPQCLLVNFASLHQKKDEILSRYWETYQLHSLYGGWDYLEPLFFGHAAGMIIEHIYNRYLGPKGLNTIVQCHEWMSAAVSLYLRRNLPPVGVVFTTHSTSLGRALAGNFRPLPPQTTAAKLEELAHEMGVSAKHSMETVAARVADCFTTVSPTTAEECVQLLHRKPDIVLPNALGDEFQDPEFAQSQAVRKARQKLFSLAEMTTGYSYDRSNTQLYLSAGRYEFTNKGIDVVLEGLVRLNKELKGKTKKKIIAFLEFPTAHAGPKRAILHASKTGERSTQLNVCTHDLTDEPNDLIMQKLKEGGLLNQSDNVVHVVYVPIYLDGNDPLIAERYYELLGGFDLAVFPSYYEPWGYTAMESIAYGVPSVSTDMAGFGRWIAERGNVTTSGVYVLKRQSHSVLEAGGELSKWFDEYLNMPLSQRQVLIKAALKAIKPAQWKNWGRAYFKGHAFAMQKAINRMRSVVGEQPKAQAQTTVPVAEVFDAEPRLRKFMVTNRIPRGLKKLEFLAKNVWWSWNPEATELFSSLDPQLWEKRGFSPTVFLNYLQPEILETASKSKAFLKKLDDVYAKFEIQTLKPNSKDEIGFFCAEYGIANCLKFYSGGLGLLAGDLLKAASDLHIPVVAVGLAYRYGYFKQKIDREGGQQHIYEKADYSSLPMQLVVDKNGEPLVVTILFPTGPVAVRGWQVSVGGVDLFLLDTDFDQNRTADRAITNNLYGGDQQHRLRQEFVLGIGGFKFLKAMGRLPRVFHMNEGHSGFIVLARIVALMQEENLKFDEALDYIRHTSIFTTHTPVAAGHDRFSEDLLRPYLSPFEEALHKDWASIMALGQGKLEKDNKDFSMTVLAIKGSERINGVSEIHGRVSRDMFRGLFPGLHGAEVPVSSITNGVHVPTWSAPEWQKIFEKHIGDDWGNHRSDPKYWEKAHKLDPKLVWKTHMSCKERLVQWLRQHVQETYKARRENPVLLTQTLANLSEEALIIGFARRFAPYKRAGMLFHNLEKLQEILGDPNKPVLFVFGGKAHPSDGPGQALIKQIVEISRNPVLAGRLIFVEGYDIHTAQMLVAGCDVWLNNPTRPLEASGTSGMKAAINGCLNLSVPDGWWAEGFNGKNGWAVGLDEDETTPVNYQNEYDSAELYRLLDREIIPTFFRRNDGVPSAWVAMMKESIATILPRFSSERMLLDYKKAFYEPSIEEAVALESDEFARLYDLVEQKKRLMGFWDSIAFLDVHTEGLANRSVTIGEPIRVHIDLSHPNLSINDIAPQVVLTRPSNGARPHFEVLPMELMDSDNQNHTSSWERVLVCNESGPHSYGVRIVPRHDKNDELLHSSIVQWL